jgi:hypothetical protein
MLVRKNVAQDQGLPLPDASIVTSLLANLASNPGLQALGDTIDHIYDVAIAFADELSDEQRAGLVKSESGRLQDHRIAFLLGYTPPTEAWLGLVTTQNTSNGQSGNSSTNRSSFNPHSPAGSRPSPGQPQRAPMPTHQRQGQNQAQQKQFNPPIHYPVKPWELLPDQGNPGGANDTAISLSLYGARKA